MHNTQLVAVAHELKTLQSDNRLMSPVCMARFKNEVEPSITSKSLLVCEGFRHDKLVGPDHRDYKRLRQALLDLPASKQPTFGGFDARQSAVILENEVFSRKNESWDKLALEIVQTDWQKRPSSLHEVIEMLKTEHHVAQLSRPPTNEEKELAHWMRFVSRRFDRHYLEGIKKHRYKFDSCFFIGGSIHALAMALKSGYPLVDLIPSDEVPTAYYGYHSTYTWPKLFNDGS